MKYVVFEMSAIENLINNQYIKSTEYLLGTQLVQTLKYNNKMLSVDSINNTYIGFQEDKCFFIGKSNKKKVLVIDLERSHLFDELTDEESIIVLQKVFRFALKYWNKSAFTINEKIITDTKKAILFPFSSSEKYKFRVAIEREPAEQRSAQRNFSSSLLVYKCGVDGAPNDTEVPVLANYNDAMTCFQKFYGESVTYFTKCETTLIDQVRDSKKNEMPLLCIDLDKGSKGSTPYTLYHNWLTQLTRTQFNFVCDLDTNKPNRVQGPAGTGKTMSLILKAIFLLENAKSKDEDINLIFFTHSISTRQSVNNIFDSVSNGKWADDNIKQKLIITSLHEFCIDTLRSSLSDFEIIDRDSLGSKEYQNLIVGEAYETVKKQTLKTYLPILSNELKGLILNVEQEYYFIHLLQHEFAVQIKGNALGLLDAYKKIPSLSSGLPTLNENDKTFIYKIFAEYQRIIESQQYFDTDDIVLTHITDYDNPIWRRKRKQSGYDHIFIDEIHLFNENERSLFHLLSKDSDVIPISFSVDISQAIGDQGIKESDYNDKYYLSNSAENTNFQVVFRNTEDIANLAMSILVSGAQLFSSILNPYGKDVQYAHTNEFSTSTFPTYEMLESESLMLQKSIVKAKELMHSKDRDYNSPVAVIIFGDKLLSDVELYLKKTNEKYVKIESRGDSLLIKKASDENSLVLASPDYIGGLEFDSVILVGIDDSRLPPKDINDISKRYLKHVSINRLYVSITRARSNVFLYGSKEHNISECLEFSINRGLVDFKN